MYGLLAVTSHIMIIFLYFLLSYILHKTERISIFVLLVTYYNIIAKRDNHKKNTGVHEQISNERELK